MMHLMLMTTVDVLPKHAEMYTQIYHLVKILPVCTNSSISHLQLLFKTTELPL